jgi:hypothetical protein
MCAQSPPCFDSRRVSERFPRTARWVRKRLACRVMARPTGASHAPERLSALRPPLDSGERSKGASPGRKNAPRERDGLFDRGNTCVRIPVRRSHQGKGARRVLAKRAQGSFLAERSQAASAGWANLWLYEMTALQFHRFWLFTIAPHTCLPH